MERVWLIPCYQSSRVLFLTPSLLSMMLLGLWSLTPLHQVIPCSIFLFPSSVQSLHCCWNFTSPIVCFQFSILLSILWNHLGCGGPACWTLTTFSWFENVLDSTVGCQICSRRKLFTYCLCALFKAEIGLKGFGG